MTRTRVSLSATTMTVTATGTATYSAILNASSPNFPIATSIVSRLPELFGETWQGGEEEGLLLLLYGPAAAGAPLPRKMPLARPGRGGEG